MSGAAVALFSGHAGDYTALRRRLVPPYDAFYGAVVDVLRLLGHAHVGRVLDLGAGTGLLSARVIDAFPAVRIELLDGSAPMLAEACERLGGHVDAVHVTDMAGALPEGPFDAIVSALAIHHLTDADKRALFARARAALRPGGVFVNAEQVVGPTRGLTRIYEARWAEDCWDLGASAQELIDAQHRMRHDLSVDTDTQLGWMRDAGFAAADTVFKSWRFSVMAGFTAVPR